MIQIQQNRIKKPYRLETTSWLFTRVAEDVNLGDQEQIQQVTRAGL